MPGSSLILKGEIKYWQIKDSSQLTVSKGANNIFPKMSDYSFDCTQSGTLKWRQSEEQKRQPKEEDKRVKDIILQRELCLGLPQALTYLISIVKGEHFVSLCTVGLRVREKEKVCV